MRTVHYLYYQPAGGRLTLAPYASEDVQPEAAYEMVYEGDVRVEDDASDIDTLERIWLTHNADERPRGQEIRSMSVGDVVEVDGRRWMAAVVGFEPMGEEYAERFKRRQDPKRGGR